MTAPTTTGRLAGKVALITGGASGIGQACAVLFAKEGADIVVADLSDGSKTISLVEAEGRKAVAIKTDTTKAEDNQAAVDLAVETFGHLDVVVASAGVASVNRSEDPASNLVENLDVEKFTRVIDINVTGVMLTDQAAIRQMLKQGTGGSIINIASTAGKIPLAGAAPYCVSKAGVHMLSKVLAVELATRGIRVNAVGPGYTRTPMWDVDEDSPAGQVAMSITPMGRNGTPEEQAQACLFLADEKASSFMTGQMLHPAGGQFTG
ncbi:SDR family NAD(P)-dependent oxidoreductase [Nakamurella leprariae]|uniref:SDR family oxidoreductase n=1 Tax=Nakamurella leprariae TaxID=2803911 RepID=A0A938YI96_9ACTN|nr:SDR family oxidoreductase [Nakamurella leprariae]MBM9468333.1 SDR family oxidoreductase [Nakamurella leprariae]